jgi:hypothetical protein
MSALCSKADIPSVCTNVCFVPTVDISRSGKDTPLAVALSRIRHRLANAVMFKRFVLDLDRGPLCWGD